MPTAVESHVAAREINEPIRVKLPPAQSRVTLPPSNCIPGVSTGASASSLRASAGSDMVRVKMPRRNPVVRADRGMLNFLASNS